MSRPRTIQATSSRLLAIQKALRTLDKAVAATLLCLLSTSALGTERYVDVNGTNATAPYSAWSTAATNIQDAIDASVAGDQVLVAAGVYQSGGKVMAGDLTNRIALDKAITVRSVEGPFQTIIEGTGATNGPAAVRCAYLADGALLNGFILRNGATRTSGDTATLQTGGGILCASLKGIVSNCVISNSTAVYGGGIANGTINNSFMFLNLATFGGAAYYANLNNCTVFNNYTTSMLQFRGAGTYGGVVRNSIVVRNYDFYPHGLSEDNYSTPSLPTQAQYSYSCTYPPKSGTGNISSGSQLLDLFRIAASSKCRGAGSAQYATGTDLDGEPWANPPSMGCDEIVMTNLVGPLSVALVAPQTNTLVNHYVGFGGLVSGRASSVAYDFGDGITATNSEIVNYHSWPTPGNYTVTFTAYNNDNPDGVSVSSVVHVETPRSPELLSATILTNGFQFAISGQTNANYTVQYTTDLTPPVIWQDLKTLWNAFQEVQLFTDSGATNEARFYRVLAY